ncbi:MAG: GNAT family N-acetyltransferase, partial [Anaerobacillus sp.]
SLWIYIQTEVSRAFIYEITIQEELQGKGFGTKAIEELEKVLQDKGIDELALHVFGHNKKAIRLYERLGFETTNVNMKKSLTSN